MSFWNRKEFRRTITMLVGMTTVCIVLVMTIIVFTTEHLLSRPSEVTAAAVTTFSVSLPENALTTDIWGVFDTQTGAILAGETVGEPHAIASVTKLFTAAAVLESGRQHTPVIITTEDLATEGRAGKLSLGSLMTPYTLLFPLLLESSNDAGAVIERGLGDTFYTTLDELKTAASLNDTKIVDATGLSPENTSTVEDLARYFAYLKRTHPHLLDITQLHTYVTPHTGYVNNDPARSLDVFAGGKHGFTPEAGKTFVGSFTVKDGTKDVGIVLLGSTNVKRDIETILAHITYK